ncbi:hypothetical protein DFQ30_001811, partial [Apophysomyces sp. BC1015]
HTMKAFQHFRQAVALPDDFGAVRPHARLFYVDDNRSCDADADVEYRETDIGQDLVSAGRVVTFSVESGEIPTSDVDQVEDLTGLLAAMRGMTLAYGDGKA